MRKPIPYQQRDFINGHCIIFHESQTWGPMAVEKL
jgi:hypothetical protein